MENRIFMIVFYIIVIGLLYLIARESYKEGYPFVSITSIIFIVLAIVSGIKVIKNG